MKSLRQLCGGVVLLLALSVSVLAGQINCPGVVDPPPDTPPTATGQIACPALVEAAVSLIQSVLSLP